LLDRASLI